MDDCQLTNYESLTRFPPTDTNTSLWRGSIWLNVTQKTGFLWSSSILRSWSMNDVCSRCQLTPTTMCDENQEDVMIQDTCHTSITDPIAR